MGKQAEVPRLPEEEVQRSAQPWSLPLPCSWQDFLEVCPRNGPAQDRARQGCSERLKHGRRFCSLGRLGHEVGWKYQDIIAALEAKRKVKGEAFHKAQSEIAQAKDAVLKDAKVAAKIAPAQKVIESYGFK